MPPGDNPAPIQVYPGHIYCSQRRWWPRSFCSNCLLDRWVHYTAAEWPAETRPCPTACAWVDQCLLPSNTRWSCASGCCYQKLLDQLWQPGTHWECPVPAMGRSKQDISNPKTSFGATEFAAQGACMFPWRSICRSPRGPEDRGWR